MTTHELAAEPLPRLQDPWYKFTVSTFLCRSKKCFRRGFQTLMGMVIRSGEFIEKHPSHENVLILGKKN